MEEVKYEYKKNPQRKSKKNKIEILMRLRSKINT